MREMEGEFRCGWMVACMKDIGNGIKLMGKVDLYTQMEMFTWEIGLMTRQKDMEFTLIWMVLNIKDIGKKISNMEKVKRLGQTLHNMREIMFKEKSMVMEYLSGQMEQYIMENFTTIIFME